MNGQRERQLAGAFVEEKLVVEGGEVEYVMMDEFSEVVEV